jgi:hypothetical protein
LRLIALFLLLTTPAFASGDCRSNWSASLRTLKSAPDPDQRSRQGQCLLRHHLDKSEVAQQVLRIIRDAKEDVLLREDLIQAFADSPLRRNIKVDEALGPELDSQDIVAVDRTVAGAQGLLALTQAVKVMNETVPVTRFEQDFFRAIAEVAVEETNPVLLRSTAVAALERAATRVVASGVYDDRSLRLTQEALSTVAARDDSGSYYSGAHSAYGRLAGSGIPHFSGRSIASQKR